MPSPLRSPPLMGEPTETWRPAHTPRPFGTLLRILGAVISACVGSLVRRLRNGPLREGWGFGLEVFAAGQRAAWALIPREGVVSWRNAVEGLATPKPSGALRSAASVGGISGDWFVPAQPVGPEEAGRPTDAAGPVMLFLHGGGYVLGSADTHLPLLADLARTTSWRVFVPDYRLAPEHPRPAAEEDALAAYRGLVASGISPTQIVIAGDSAGGNLSLVTLLRLREAGDPLPAAAVLICPWTDLSCSGKSFESNDAFDYIGLEAARFSAREYLDGADPRDPAISPLYADLSGLPPLLIQTGSAETLHDQIVQFAERASAAGVEARLSVYENMIHDWQMFAFIPQSRHAIDEIASFAREAVGSR